MSGTGQGSGDVQKLLSLDAGALQGKKCGCSGHGGECCCCTPHHGFPWVGPSDTALKERAVFLEQLIPAAKELLAVAQKALTVGATTAAEIRDMQRLEYWLGRLLVEQEMHRKPPKKR